LGEDGAFPWREYRDTCQLALKFKLLEAPVPQMGDGNRHSLDIQEVKQANDIVATIERYTTLRKSGRNYYSGLCPLHDDTHPSFFVYPDDQRWWCFGCNRGGDIIDFAQAMHRVTTSEAVKMLAGGVR
jgi:DNA primase